MLIFTSHVCHVSFIIHVLRVDFQFTYVYVSFEIHVIRVNFQLTLLFFSFVEKLCLCNFLDIILNDNFEYT